MKNLFFQDRIAIITGASKSIGRATALELARRGAHLCLASRDLAGMQQTAEGVRSLGREALIVQTDVTSQEQVQALVQAAIRHFQRVDILVANAGIYVRKPLVQLDIATLQHSMATNFYGAAYCVLATLPHMLERGSGHIVLVSSFDGKKALPGDAPYASAKFALNGLGEAMRQELSPRGIYTSIILPGRVATDFMQGLRVPRIQPPIPAEQVARAIASAIQHRRAEVIMPARVLGLYYLNAIHPRLGDLAVRLFHLQGWEV
jgi:NAD(P)-dependent dehydrogenase (short-subunit alcohol dehydrogenase family)